MAATHQQQASSSGSSYEVFLSFHGGDVRRSFADHLYHTLEDTGIRTFRDDEELKKGKEIAPELLAAIQQSIISIPIFSSNYASSKWCLNELNEICECKRTRNQTVFPIFYKVEPRDVRNQTGGYAEAFDKEHPKHFHRTTVQRWQKALQEIGRLNGWHFMEETYEGELLRKVVKEVTSTLNKRTGFASNKLVGIESHRKKMMELLDIERKVTKIVKICGFGGIGKTTIAKAIYNEVLSRFDEYAFVENVREDARNGICYLQNKFVGAILKDKNPKFVDKDDGIKVIQRTLHKKKVLVVLDDVDRDEQVKFLIGDGEWLGIGSRIIITSRNKDILKAREAHEIYEPKSMDLGDSLELFSHHAFKRNQPQEDYLAISQEIVKTCGGLPLALTVIGSFLFEKRKPVWESKLKMLQKVPDDHVMERLKISYDDLKDMEQQMFLDIACFFIGMKQDIVSRIWEGCNFYPEVGLDILCAKSLITINRDGELRMHDVFRDLGRDIVRQESRKPQKRSRIWFEEEVLDVLFKQKGKIKCSGLSIDFKKSNIDSKSRSRSKCLMGSRLDAMTELRLLQLNHAQISGNSINCFSELRWLSWKGCPEQYALTNFRPEKLVVLDLSNSEITENWRGWDHIKMAVNLKVLKLELCKQLRSTPDLSENRLLEVLSFKYCEKLVRIDTSIGYLTSLVILDLSNCKNLVGFPTEIGSLMSLVTLHVSDCHSLVEFPIEICQLTTLKTLILHWFYSLIHLDLGRMTSLTKLELAGCHSLKAISNLPPGLTSIGFFNCKLLQSIPSLPSCLTTIEILECYSLPSIPSLPSGLTSIHISRCNLVRSILLPSSLTTLLVESCSSLVELASGFGSGLRNLKTLKVYRCRSLEEIEGVDEKLESLEECEILWCYSFKLLPKLRFSKNLRSLSLIGLDAMSHIEGKGMDSLEKLYMEICRSLKKIPYLRDSKGIRELSIRKCPELTEIECLEGYVSLQKLSIGYISLTTLSFDISTLKNLQELEIMECENLSEIPGLSGLEALCSLKIIKCCSLERLPDLSNLKKLRKLRIVRCEKLPNIPGLDTLEALGSLTIFRCSNSMERLPDLSNLKELKKLKIHFFQSLSGIPGLDGLESLEVLEIKNCKNLSEIHGVDRLESLRSLQITTCCSLQRLPDLSNLKKLRELHFVQCENLSDIPGLDGLESLEVLEIEECNNLKQLRELQIVRHENLFEIPDLEGLESLEELETEECNNIA